jgi:Tol biopolymer transport system component
VRGFGRVWREQLGGPQAAIGWALENEIGGQTSLQDFEGGVIVQIGADILLLYRQDMTWQTYSPGIGVPAYPMPPSLQLAFVRGFVQEADIWAIDANGQNPRQIIAGDGDQSEPDWSPDGLYIVYQSDQAGNYDIWIADADGGNPRALTVGSVDEREPDWSPDGRHIVYRRGGQRNGDGELWVMDAAGGGRQRLAGKLVLGRAPVWSPDGSQVAFMSQRSGAWEIYVLDLQGGELRRLTNCSTHCRFPGWSLDGATIAYNVTTSNTDFTPAQVWQQRADGSGAPQLFIEGNNPGRPAWSAEGLIAFNSSEGLEIMNADGGGRHKLPNSDEGWAPTWSR